MACYKIKPSKPIAFYGSTKRFYNVFSDPCCWTVMLIEDYAEDQPNPRNYEPSKGESFGLTCWDVMNLWCDIDHMELVSLNGIHPGYVGDSETLTYEREFSQREDVTSYSMNSLLEIFRKDDSILKKWLTELKPELDINTVTNIECTGKYTSKKFPSNVTAFLHLPVRADRPVPRECISPINSLDMTSQSLEMQVILMTCGWYNMIPENLLRDIGLLFNFTTNYDEKITISVDLNLRDSFYHRFREIDPKEKIKVTLV